MICRNCCTKVSLWYDDIFFYYFISKLNHNYSLVRIFQKLRVNSYEFTIGSFTISWSLVKLSLGSDTITDVLILSFLELLNTLFGPIILLSFLLLVRSVMASLIFPSSLNYRNLWAKIPLGSDTVTVSCFWNYNGSYCFFFSSPGPILQLILELLFCVFEVGYRLSLALVVTQGSVDWYIFV